MMRHELIRIWAFALRNLLMASRNIFFVFELTFWPGVAMPSWPIRAVQGPRRCAHFPPVQTNVLSVAHDVR